jgi:hypothetical protein
MGSDAARGIAALTFFLAGCALDAVEAPPQDQLAHAAQVRKCTCRGAVSIEIRCLVSHDAVTTGNTTVYRSTATIEPVSSDDFPLQQDRTTSSHSCQDAEPDFRTELEKLAYREAWNSAVKNCKDEAARRNYLDVQVSGTILKKFMSARCTDAC